MTKVDMKTEWITTKEAAVIMNVALSTVSRLCRKSRHEPEPTLVCRQFGEGYRSTWQVSKSSAKAYVKSVGGRPRKVNL
jgi:hypothetical protein